MQKWPVLDWIEESLVKENNFWQIIVKIQKDRKCLYGRCCFFERSEKTSVWISLWWCHFWIWLETIWLRSIQLFLGRVLNTNDAIVFGSINSCLCDNFWFSGDLRRRYLRDIYRPVLGSINLLLEPLTEPNSSFANNFGYWMLSRLLGTYSIRLPYRRNPSQEEEIMHY